VLGARNSSIEGPGPIAPKTLQRTINRTIARGADGAEGEGPCDATQLGWQEQALPWSAYLITAILSPAPIAVPSATSSSTTSPAIGALISFSIFIASITQTTAPASTF
jgi:hypothetical protein